MTRLFFIQTTLIAVVLAVHIAALRLYLYWLFPWLDAFVHFFGAMGVALVAVWALTILGWRVRFFEVLAVLVAVSIGWELFELWNGTPREANFAFDTAVDLSMDFLGGLSGFAAAQRILARESRDTIPPHEAA